VGGRGATGGHRPVESSARNATKMPQWPGESVERPQDRNLTGTVAFPVSTRPGGGARTKGRDLSLHVAVMIGGAGFPCASAARVDSDPLQELASTRARTARPLRVIHRRGVKVVSRQFGRIPRARRGLFDPAGAFVPGPEVDCLGEYCVASWQLVREAEENGAWCCLGDTFTSHRP